MNKVILMGRLTRDPDVRQPQGENSSMFARYTLAVDRRMRRDNNDPNAQTADFISCVVFGKGAEIAEKYLHKGSKIAITGRIQTGKYTNREGQTVYTTDVVIEDQEFAESKAASQNQGEVQQSGSIQQSGQAAVNVPEQNVDENGFLRIPDDVDADLPFR